VKVEYTGRPNRKFFERRWRKFTKLLSEEKIEVLSEDPAIFLRRTRSANVVVLKFASGYMGRGDRKEETHVLEHLLSYRMSKLFGRYRRDAEIDPEYFFVSFLVPVDDLEIRDRFIADVGKVFDLDTSVLQSEKFRVLNEFRSHVSVVPARVAIAGGIEKIRKVPEITESDVRRRFSEALSSIRYFQIMGSNSLKIGKAILNAVDDAGSGAEKLREIDQKCSGIFYPETGKSAVYIPLEKKMDFVTRFSLGYGLRELTGGIFADILNETGVYGWDLRILPNVCVRNGRNVTSPVLILSVDSTDPLEMLDRVHSALMNRLQLARVNETRLYSAVFKLLGSVEPEQVYRYRRDVLKDVDSSTDGFYGRMGIEDAVSLLKERIEEGLEIVVRALEKKYGKARENTRSSAEWAQLVPDPSEVW